MKVTISVHGRWHAFDLASALYKKGKLNQLITTYPEFLVRKLIPGQFPIASKPGLELRRRLYDNWKVGPKPDLEIAKAFGKFAKKSVMENPGIFVGWSSATLEAIEKVKMLGGKVVVERGSTHIEHQTTVLRTAYEELGCRFEDTHEEIIDRELQEYYAADAICVPTYFAAETFIARGIKKEKVFINPYGVDLSQFTQNSFNSSGLPKRVLFVGAASIRKGIPWLLKAIETLQTEVECHLVGPIDGIIKDKYASQFPANLIVRGPLSRVDILQEFREADIFCLPSIEEGFPLSLLQAMASGLPCVVTNEASGGIIEDNINGIVVASKDSIALEGALKLLVADEQLRREFAIKSRRDVETGFSWNDYGMRAITTYNQIGLI